jgi:hypothetical protein
MTDLFPITPAEVVTEMERELKMRHHVYTKQVADKKLSRDTADRRIAIVQKVIGDYRGKM